MIMTVIISHRYFLWAWRNFFAETCETLFAGENDFQKFAIFCEKKKIVQFNQRHSITSSSAHPGEFFRKLKPTCIRVSPVCLGCHNA